MRKANLSKTRKRYLKPVYSNQTMWTNKLD